MAALRKNVSSGYAGPIDELICAGMQPGPGAFNFFGMVIPVAFACLES